MKEGVLECVDKARNYEGNIVCKSKCIFEKIEKHHGQQKDENLQLDLGL